MTPYYSRSAWGHPPYDCFSGFTEVLCIRLEFLHGNDFTPKYIIFILYNNIRIS